MAELKIKSGTKMKMAFNSDTPARFRAVGRNRRLASFIFALIRILKK